ncbi:hypothetical protein [Secundilactobacillus paracollinoides]|uniref:hypothetical protein n=1 Tax=Secundilactobacillus paracollinoides TaxID=240427 RepID=UPI0006D0C6DE|nr:hypothetical protein [Secundilactobacillus paracollinoides]
MSKLSSYAIYQAKYLVAQLTRPDQYPIDYPVPAMTVFSLPKLGQVGVSTNCQRNRTPTRFRQLMLPLGKPMLG